ncbi:MAG: DNA replication/repair protein RecF [Alphaproteobacteria bacterium]|nr:DNA replication/repair protein RecF [Alphaproteobacteria bacterium]
MRAQAITRLHLEAFRNYDTLNLDLSNAPVILVGENGAGKTNILEAISLLSPGRGLRRAAIAELHNTHTPADKPWAAFFELHGKRGEVSIGMGRDPESTAEKERRLLRIDGKTVKGQTALADHANVIWLTPEMDRLLAESASERRKFADRLAFALDPTHSTRINRYEEAMRARAKLLRDNNTDDAWLNALEASMAQDGIAIAAARNEWINHIRHHLNDDPHPFPRVTVSIDGFLEKYLQSHDALDTETLFKTMLKENRAHDAASGITTTGTHRSDLEVHHVTKNMPAHLCSTGEQKALLISLVLAQARLLCAIHQSAPLILLDDITAHLDEMRRDALAAQLIALGGQSWLSGTDTSFFTAFQQKAQFLTIENGHIKSFVKAA